MAVTTSNGSTGTTADPHPITVAADAARQLRTALDGAGFGDWGIEPTFLEPDGSGVVVAVTAGTATRLADWIREHT